MKRKWLKLLARIKRKLIMNEPYPEYVNVNNYMWKTELRYDHGTQPKININGKDFTVEELNALIETAKGK